MMDSTHSPWKNSVIAGPTQDCMFPAALEALEHLGDSLERIVTPGSTDYAGRTKALPYEKALPYVRKAYTNLIGAKSRQEALRAMQHLSSYLDGICDGWYQRIVTLINAVNIDDTNVMASSKGNTMSIIKTQIQALARLQSIAATFYVYHKVKGDRAGGPDYDLLKTFTDKTKADKYASEYNDQKGYKAGKGMHSAVVRTTKVKEESIAATFYVYHKVKGDRMGGPDYDLLADFTDKAKADKYADDYNKKSKDKFHSAVVRTTKIKEESSTKVQADVDQEDAIDIIVDVFNDYGLAIKFSKILDGDPNFLVFSFASPITGKKETFFIELHKKEIFFDGMGSESFSGGEMLDTFIKSSPDMVQIKKTSARKFQKWANDTYKTCTDLAVKLDKYNKFATSLSDSITSLQTMVAMNKFINRRKKDMKKTVNDQVKRNAKAK